MSRHEATPQPTSRRRAVREAHQLLREALRLAGRVQGVPLADWPKPDLDSYVAYSRHLDPIAVTAWAVVCTATPADVESELGRRMARRTAA